MELITLAKQFWLFCGIYFFVGFGGFYLVCLIDKKRYGVGSINGFWGDLFVASMWGILWAIFFVVFPIVWIFKQVEKRTGVYININNLLGTLVFGYFTAYNFAKLVSKLAHLNFSGSRTNLFGFFVCFLFFYISLKAIRQRPSLPKWVQKGIEKDLAKHKLAKKNSNP